MDLLICLVSFALFVLVVPHTRAQEEEKEISVVIIAGNREHTLPYFLTFFERLSYPKDKISVFIRSDHNVDNTTAVLFSWLKINSKKYKSCDVKTESNSKAYTEINSKDLNLMRLKEEGLKTARQMGADYVLFLDTDVFLTDKNVLQKMIREEKVIISPMLISTTQFSNFWGAMTESFWYKRSEDYVEIVYRTKIGCFPVALVSDCFLVDLKHRKSKYLSFEPEKLPRQFKDVPEVDVIAFSLMAKSRGIDRYICNKEKYGFVLLPTSIDDGKKKDLQQITILGLEHVIHTKKSYEKYLNGSSNDAVPANMGVNKVYCINLLRRHDRRKLMEDEFKRVGLEATFVNALDWKDINSSYAKSMKLNQIDMYDKFPPKLGCACNFITHHTIWKEVVDKEYKMVMVFEDDAAFGDDFKLKLNDLMADIQRQNIVWDLIYLQRNARRTFEEYSVFGSDLLVKPSHSWSTLAYLVSLNGAKKLTRDQKLFHKLIPVDEYLSVMFGRHPDGEWASVFKPQDLIAYAAIANIVTCHHKDGSEVSDTQNSIRLKALLATDQNEV